MNSNTHIDGLLTQLESAKAIATEMLNQEVEPEIRVGYLRDILKNWDRLENITKAIEAIQDALEEIEGGLAISGHFFSETHAEITWPAPKLVTPIDSIREFVVTVTDGMIRQNLLTFTRHIVPRGPFKLGEQITIILNGEKVISEIISPGNKLRERGAVGRYYRDLHIQAGDSIALVKNETGEWVASVRRNPSPATWQNSHQF